MYQLIKGQNTADELRTPCSVTACMFVCVGTTWFHPLATGVAIVIISHNIKDT